MKKKEFLKVNLRPLLLGSLIFIIVISCKKESENLSTEIQSSSTIIYGSSVNLCGKIISSGGSNIKEKGFLLDTLQNCNMQRSSKIVVQDPINNSLFYAFVDSLNPEKAYYVKAYIINGKGETSFSNELSITFNKFDFTGFTPSSGVPGQIMELYGHNFGNFRKNYQIYFGNSVADIISVCEDLITIKIPKNSDTLVTIKIINKTKEVSSLLKFSYSIYITVADYEKTFTLNRLLGPTFKIDTNIYCLPNYDLFHPCDFQYLLKFDKSAQSWENSISLPLYRSSRVAALGNNAYFLTLDNCNQGSWGYYISSFRCYNFSTAIWSNLSFPFDSLVTSSLVFKTNSDNDAYNQLNITSSNVYLSHNKIKYDTNDAITRMFWKYDSNSDHWQQMNDCPINGAVFTKNDTIYLFNSSEMYQYYPQTDEWVKILSSNLPITTFYYFSFIKVDNLVYFIDYYTGDIWQFSSDYNKWVKYCHLPIKWRVGDAFYDGNCIYISNGLINEAWAIDEQYFKIYIYQ
jgi:hypothetical protein